MTDNSNFQQSDWDIANSFEPPKWSPQLTKALNEKFKSDWKHILGEQIVYWLDTPPVCIAYLNDPRRSLTKCGLPADWWYPTTKKGYCNDCIECFKPGVKKGFAELWLRIRLNQIYDMLPLLGVAYDGQ